MRNVKIRVQRELSAKDTPLPQYQTEGASGMDLCSSETEEIVLKPGQIKLISTGIRVAIPLGYEIQIRPRSGLALKHGISMVNSPGTIDSDYRGVIGLIVINHGDNDFVIAPGMRIAQMVVQEVIQAIWQEEGDLDNTNRSEGGFGHTGN
ncbi:MAG: dUTP pyrophosphatase [Candidatus Omnitrophota bacterium]|jgi:dUTP pyrophosphatase